MRINANLICASVTRSQTTTESSDPARSAEVEGDVGRSSPIPYDSSVLHATPVAMSDAIGGTVLLLLEATSGNIKLIYKYPRVLNEQGEKRQAQRTRRHLFLQNLLHIADLIIGGVGPSFRPDLCAGARRRRLFPMLPQGTPRKIPAIRTPRTSRVGPKATAKKVVYTNRLALEGGPVRMSNDLRIHSDEPVAVGPPTMTTPGEHPPHDGSRDEHLAATSER